MRIREQIKEEMISQADQFHRGMIRDLDKNIEDAPMYSFEFLNRVEEIRNN